MADSRQARLWDELVVALGIDLDVGPNFVTAEQIHSTLHTEPRNMAYIDNESRLPDSFRRRHLFVLPVSNGRYAIVKGKGFEAPKPENLRTEVFRPELDPGVALIGTLGGEGSLAAYAFNSGLISHVGEFSPVHIGPSDRFFLDRFEFRVDGSAALVQQGAQAQVDGFYFGSGGAMLMEFKAHPTRTFVIRQLYYPFRHWLGRSGSIGCTSVRPFFVDFDRRTLTYRFLEYEFTDVEDYESIRLIRARAFRIEPRRRHELLIDQVAPDLQVASLSPQADNFERVLRVPLLVGGGEASAAVLAEAEQFHVRQSSYYRRAAEALGLVRASDERYRLTPLGEDFVRLNAVERNKLAAKQMLRIPAVYDVVRSVVDEPGRELSKVDLGRALVNRDPRLSGSTVARRAQTLVAWLRWLQASTGIVSVGPSGSVRAAVTDLNPR